MSGNGLLQPKAESDGKYPVEKAKAISGEKLLRNIMTDNKIELYATYVCLIPHDFQSTTTTNSFCTTFSMAMHYFFLLISRLVDLITVTIAI